MQKSLLALYKNYLCSSVNLYYIYVTFVCMYTNNIGILKNKIKYYNIEITYQF